MYEKRAFWACAWAFAGEKHGLHKTKTREGKGDLLFYFTGENISHFLLVLVPILKHHHLVVSSFLPY
jgi:hypothetical protein